MKRTARVVIAAFVCAAALQLAAPQASEAGYPTNGCVSKKTKSAGKFCQSVLKAWSKWHKNPAADPVGDDRDASILKASDKLGSSWTKAEDKADKKSAECFDTTATSAEIDSDIQLAVDALQSSLGLGDGGAADRSCRSAALSAAAKLCSGLLSAQSKYIKDPAKDPDGDARSAKQADASAKFTTSYGDAASECTTAIPAAATALADIDELTDEIETDTTTSPNIATTFQHEIPPTTVIYQSKELHPVCSKGTPYSYFWKRGTTNKLLMYYQGGGACWSNASCNLIGTFKDEAGAGDNPDLVGTGFADPDNVLNIFADWHVVFVSYCTGDVHWGDNPLQFYNDGPINHVGRVNASVAEKFAREHFLDPEFIFVTGSSAGSYGAIMNSAYLMEFVYPQTEFAVLGDAGIGVITQDWLETYQDGAPPPAGGRVWNLQKNLPTFIPGVELPVSNLSMAGLISSMAAAYPNNRFASYESAYDGGNGGQASFYHVMKSGSNVLDWPNWWEDQCEWTACMRQFKSDIAAVSPNYRSYTSAGSRHTIYGSDKLYVDTTGLVPPITFRDWVDAMINDDVGWVNLDCQDGGDCDLLSTCQGGDIAGQPCTVDADCTGGGDCDHDPDATDPPYNGDGTVTCAPTVCPCGPVNCP